MILVDANLLLYAINRDLPQHKIARQWLEKVPSGNNNDFKRFPGLRHVNPLVSLSQ